MRNSSLAELVISQAHSWCKIQHPNHSVTQVKAGCLGCCSTMPRQLLLGGWLGWLMKSLSAQATEATHAGWFAQGLASLSFVVIPHFSTFCCSKLRWCLLERPKVAEDKDVSSNREDDGQGPHWFPQGPSPGRLNWCNICRVRRPWHWGYDGLCWTRQRLTNKLRHATRRSGQWGAVCKLPRVCPSSWSFLSCKHSFRYQPSLAPFCTRSPL